MRAIINEIIKKEKATLIKGKVAPKLFFVTKKKEKGIISMFFEEPKQKHEIVKKAGSYLAMHYKDIEWFGMSSDANFVKLNIKSKDKKELELLKKLENGELRVSELPDKYKKECLVISFTNRTADNSYQALISYKRVNGEIKFNKSEIKNDKDVTGYNLLNKAWVGYAEQLLK